MLLVHHHAHALLATLEHFLGSMFLKLILAHAHWYPALLVPVVHHPVLALLVTLEHSLGSVGHKHTLALVHW